VSDIRGLSAARLYSRRGRLWPKQTRRRAIAAAVFGGRWRCRLWSQIDVNPTSGGAVCERL